jgi:hypothetical protein
VVDPDPSIGHRSMTDGNELSALPETYALALRLWAEGLDDAAIGRVLAIEAESVGPLLLLARSKLAGIAQRHHEEPTDGPVHGR